MGGKTFDIGDVVRLKGAFTDSADAAIDPSVVRFSVKKPDGTLVEYLYLTDSELVKESTGNYYVDYSPDLQGKYTYRFYSTGTGKAAEETTFFVNELVAG